MINSENVTNMKEMHNHRIHTDCAFIFELAAKLILLLHI